MSEPTPEGASPSVEDYVRATAEAFGLGPDAAVAHLDQTLAANADLTPETPSPAATEGEVDVAGLLEAIERGLRKCRVEDGSPVSLIREGDLFHITHMVTTEVLANFFALAERVRVVEGERDAAESEAVSWSIKAGRLSARAESAEAARADLVAKVEALHPKITGCDCDRGCAWPGKDGCEPPARCLRCQVSWPCPTAALLAGGAS